MNDDREHIFTCEGCSKPIFEGDKYHSGSDVELCEVCAPTYADLLNSCSMFKTGEDETVKFQDAMRAYNKHIAFGGSPDDKIVRSL